MDAVKAGDETCVLRYALLTMVFAGRHALWHRPTKGLINCIVGEDWIVQRISSGELEVALYINSYHRFFLTPRFVLEMSKRKNTVGSRI